MAADSAGFSSSQDECGTQAPRSQLTEAQWLLICDLFPVPKRGRYGGRPRVDARRCLEGILWVLRSGARWKDLPKSFPSYVTCWRRFVEWSVAGVWHRAWSRLVGELDRRGEIEWQQGFADGTFASAKKGAIVSVRPNGAKAPNSWCSSMGEVCL